MNLFCRSSNSIKRILNLPLILLPTVILSPAWGANPPVPPRAVLTLTTDQYEIRAHRDGAVSAVDGAGSPVFIRMLPAVELDDGKGIRFLRPDPRRAQRRPARDILGEGPGLLIGGDNLQWQLVAYPGKPWLAVRVIYANTTAKSQRVWRLIPWHLAPRRSLWVTGPASDQAVLLDNGRLFRTFCDLPSLNRNSCTAQWNVALFNPASGHTGLAGFVTFNRSVGEIEVARTENAPANGFDRFSASCVFDPPLELPPGGQVESETLMLNLTERDPFSALERYGRACAAVSGSRQPVKWLPHGWDSWSTRYHSDISEAILLENLAAQDRKLKRYGWTHFAVDDGWQRRRGDWEPHPERFPQGIRIIADEAHRRSMTASLWISPFAVDPDSELARSHPDWLIPPRPGRGRLLMGDRTRVLDPTQPEAARWLEDLGRKITVEWGFDGIVEADYAYYLMLCDGFSEPVTPVEALRRGMAALRAGMRADAFLLTTTPQPVNAAFARGIRTGMDCAPQWRAGSMAGPWGAVEALTSAIARYYVTPHWYYPDQDCVFFETPEERQRWRLDPSVPPLTESQTIAWLTGATLTGGVVKIGHPFTALNDRQVDLLRRVLPVPPVPARPIDLFRRFPPCIWRLNLEDASGCKRCFAALFNWDANRSQTLSLTAADLELRPDVPLAVFNFWAGQYAGSMQGQLQVEVPPASVRLLGIREPRQHPFLLASDHHLLQGALDFGPEQWDPATGTLTGTFPAAADTPYSFSFLIPDERWTLRDAALTPERPLEIRRSGRVVTMRFHTGDHSGPAAYRLTFTGP